MDDDVYEVDGGEGDLVDEHGAHGVEEDLEGTEEGLAEEGVEENSFEAGGEVGIEAIDAERFVVSEVVGLFCLVSTYSILFPFLFDPPIVLEESEMSLRGTKHYTGSQLADSQTWQWLG